MRVFFSGLVAAIVLGVAAGVILRGAQDPVYESYSSSSVRIGEPGDNLVGRSWSGNPSVSAQGSRALKETRLRVQ